MKNAPSKNRETMLSKALADLISAHDLLKLN